MRRLFAVLVAVAACAYLYATEPSAEGQTCTYRTDCTETPERPEPVEPVTPAGDHPLPTCVACEQIPVGDPTEPVPFDDGDPAYPLDELVPETSVAGGPVSAAPSFSG